MSIELDRIFGLSFYFSKSELIDENQMFYDAASVIIQPICFLRHVYTLASPIAILQ